jgi:hypothetical protein
LPCAGCVNSASIAPDLTVSNSFTVGNSAIVGSLQITKGYIQIPARTGPPPASDCTSANQAGRMVVGTDTQKLYICTGANGWIIK